MQSAPESATHTFQAMSYPTIPPSPGSPTLTNPDMILPDYDDSISSPDRLHSSLEMWKNAQGLDMQFDQFDLSPHAISGPITPTTPIIYGNGTMLSDIGEVTEAESVCGPGKSRSVPPRMNDDLRTMVQDTTKRKAHMSRERRASMDSNSTITTLEPPIVFADFDDTVSVDDSNFQGDDEESVADSYIDDESVQEGPSPIRDRSLLEGDSTALSRRAEQILANAKQRLTTMENNLNRARTIQSPTFSSFGSESTASPPRVRPNTAIHNDSDPSNSSKPRFGHARISSENNVPTDLKPSVYTPRSSSALGAAGGYRPPPLISRDVNHALDSPRESLRERGSFGSLNSARNQLSPHMREPMLESLNEDEVAGGMDSSRPSLENTRLEAFLSPTFGSYNDLGLKRSASTAQMRDIKEQMNDLKGRLSTLRDQARADTMKRRSLQSLRTPSPFTHSQVDQWYAAPKKSGDISPVQEDSAEQPSTDENMSSIDVSEVKEATPSHHSIDDSSSESHYTDLDEEVPHTRLSPADSRAQLHLEDIDAPAVQDVQEEEEMHEDVDVDKDDDMRTEDGFQDVDSSSNYDDSASESGNSSYHDTVQNQVSHEDREDAFDYEHFFLHSAMGSMSQRKLRRTGSESESSYESDDSTETTRGPTTTTTTTTTMSSRPRRGSNASTSTADSFATATEGRNTRAEERAGRSSGTLPMRVRSQTPNRAKRSTFEGTDPTLRSQSSAATFPHHPSLSSLDSPGTNRSFPLVGGGGGGNGRVSTTKTNGATGMLTPRDSPDQSLKQISETLLSDADDAASLYDKDGVVAENGIGGGAVSTIETLQRDDQILVERLVASLGKCILGLAESGRATPESRMFRRRIEAARRLLEGVAAEEPSA